MKKVTIFAVFVLLFSISAAKAQKKNTKKNRTTKNYSASNISKEILNEINRVRMNPKEYIDDLRNLKRDMNGKTLRLPDGALLKTIEGVAAIDDAIRDLEKISGLKPIKFSEDLSKVADIQLTDLKENIYLRHKGKDGSDLDTRISRIGVVGKSRAENISYYSRGAKLIVLSLIIDDGVYNRVHRRNILNKKFKQIGIAYGDSNQKVAVCVMVFADEFEKLKDKPVAF